MTKTHDLLSKTPYPVFHKVGDNLYRLESTDGYYALLKRSDKQFRRSLKTATDRKLAERHLTDLRREIATLWGKMIKNRSHGWFRTPVAKPAVALRLLCIPYAGAGASVLQSWVLVFGKAENAACFPAARAQICEKNAHQKKCVVLSDADDPANVKAGAGHCCPGYTGLQHMVLGSTAERVIRYVPCPVLTVHTREK